MTTVAANTSNQTSPSTELATTIRTGMAVAQTSYAINNGGGLTPGEPLRMIEDAALINVAGARALNVTLPDGYVIQGVYRNEKTGLDAYFAVNKETKKMLVGFAGTNGMGIDRPDTSQDILSSGVGHATELIQNKDFLQSFADNVQLIGGIKNLKELLIAGQSLGGGIARIFGAMALFGVPHSTVSDTNDGLGLNPNQISVVSINGFGSEYALKQTGFSEEQIETYYRDANLNSIVVVNSRTGSVDVVSRIGGQHGGAVWALDVQEETSISGMHRINFGVAEGVDLLEGDLTKLKPVSLDLFSHESISSNLSGLQGIIPIANNRVSLSWAGYVAVLLSKPGEGAAGFSMLIEQYLGVPKPLARAFGAATELLFRTLPLANAVQAAQLLLGGYALGQALGSKPAVEIQFPELQAGWTRTDLTPKDSEPYLQGWRYVLDHDPSSGINVVRAGNGITQEVHPDGTIIYTHPQFGLGIFQADGSGTLHLKNVDAKTGEITNARVSFDAGTQIEMTADGWRTVRTLDAESQQIQFTYYTGHVVTVIEGQRTEVEKNGKFVRDFSFTSNTRYRLLSDQSLPVDSLQWTTTRNKLANGDILTITRDEDRRVIEVIKEENLAGGQRRITTTDGTGDLLSTRLQERLNTTTTRTITRNGEGALLETRVVQQFQDGDEVFFLDDVTNHSDSTRTLITRDAHGAVRESEPIALNAAPVQSTQQFHDQVQADVADFLTALRRKDKLGLILSSTRLALDYARTEGMVTLRYDTFLGDVSNGLALISSLRALGSGDTLAQVGGAVGLLNTTNYFAGRMAGGTGYLTGAQAGALSTAGALLSLASLAHLGEMLEHGQIGSAMATVVSSVNAVGYLAGSSSLMGSGALIAINPIALVVFAVLFDSLFAEDPPPPPPQGIATFVRLDNGALGFEISEDNPMGRDILSAQIALLLPKIESQLSDANLGITQADHALVLVASRMPTVRLFGWPSRDNNGVDNYFFALEQSDPLQEAPTLLGLARQDLVSHYAETLFLPQAIVQQWEVDHLRSQFGPAEADWQTEGAWLRSKSPIEQQRSLLQHDADRLTALWKASAKVELVATDWQSTQERLGNVTAADQGDVQRTQQTQAAMEHAAAVLKEYDRIHPLDPAEAARATPLQEAEFARSHAAREQVSLQWLKVIAVDLGGDGVSITDLPGFVETDLDSIRQRRVARFDVDGDGFAEATQWLAASEAMLGIDRSGNGLIDDGSELFNGNDTPTDQHGLASLAYFDANGDGRLTGEDPAFQQLRLWVDLDGDGSAGALEVFDMQMHTTLSSGSSQLDAMAVSAIDLTTATLHFADGSSAPLTETALLAHTDGIQVVMDEPTGNLNVLHENGMRENYITLVDDMSALSELQSADLGSARRAELEALALRYGLNPASEDFASVVQSLRATGRELEHQDTVIYFGDEDVWVDPQVRQRLEQMRISFRQLSDPGTRYLAGENQLARFGSALDAQALNTVGGFDDHWVASRTLAPEDIISDAPTAGTNTSAAMPDQWILPADVYSLMQVAKGAQVGGLVTQQALLASDPVQPDASLQLRQVFSTAQPVARLATTDLSAEEDSVVAMTYAQIEQEARLLIAGVDPLTHTQFVGIRSARFGQVQLDDSKGQILFRPQQDYVGEAGFTYVIADQNGRLHERDVRITLRAVNDAPRLSSETIHSREDIPLLINPLALLANDRDPEGDALRIIGLGRNGMGRAELLGNGQIHYTPPSDQYGVTDTIEYVVQDSQGASAIGTIRIVLDAADDAPSVVSERIIHAREDQTLRIASRLLLWNDLDLDTDARVGAARLRITAVGSPEHGSVRLDSGGEVVFVPDANYNGEAAFSYTVTDESGLSTTGRALIAIEAVADAPLVADEHIQSKEDERLVIDSSLLLQNEFDLDIARGEKQTLTVVAVDEARGGLVHLQDGRITFVPTADYNGEAGFRYTVSDGAGGFGQGQAIITIDAVNDAPVLHAVQLSALEETALTIPDAQFLQGVTDIDGGDHPHFTLLSVANPQGGTLVQSAGQVIFKPTIDFVGTASFEYAVADEQGASTTGIAAININNVNDAPAFMSGSRFEPVGEEDQEVRMTESALTKMFWDADGDAITIDPGSLRAVNAGDSVRLDTVRHEIVFRAAPNANGIRQLAFTVSDGQSNAATQNLNINLRPVNDAPVVKAVGFQMLEDAGHNNPTKTDWSYLSHALLLSGATDPDGDILSVVAVGSGRTNSGLVVEVFNDVAYGRIGIKAPQNYNGAIEFDFTVQDSKGATTTQKTYGMVTAVNDAPVLEIIQTGTRAVTSHTLFNRTINYATWRIDSWDPDLNETFKFAIDRNPLRGSVWLEGSISSHDAAGGLREQFVIQASSGSGNTTSTESVWFSVTDASGGKSFTDAGFIGRYNTDPVVVDLDQDGLQFIDIADSKVRFDSENDGVLRRSAWIGPREGIVAWDHDQNGIINRLDEVAFASHLDPALAGLSDLQALQQVEFDANQDGIFDDRDAKWQQFFLWRDLNSDGISQTGELHTLTDAGIEQLALNANVLNRAEGPDVRVRGYTRVAMRDGRLLQAADVWLDTEPDDSTDTSPPNLSAREASLLEADQMQSLLSQLAATPTGSNRAPLLYGYVPTQYADEGSVFHIDIAPNMFIDPDSGDALRFTARLADGSPLPDWLHFDAARLRFEGQPTQPDVGVVQIALTATDATQAATTTTFNLVTSEINRAPVLNGSVELIGWQANQHNTLRLPQNLFTDANANDHLFIQVSLADGTPLPDWMDFDPLSLTLSGQPDTGQLAAPIALRIIATDLAGASIMTTTTLAALIKGSAGNDTLYGSAASELLWGEAGDDRLIGAGGNDQLTGGAGQDTYVFGQGWGQDSIAGELATSGERNVIEFAADIAPADVRIVRGLDSFHLAQMGTSNTINVEVGSTAIDGALVSGVVSAVRFANGETWSALSDMDIAFSGALDALHTNFAGSLRDDSIWGTEGKDTIAGLDGDDFIGGFDGDDRLEGGQGDDALYGGEGNDVLDGGSGNDILQGEFGDDLYHFSRSGGTDLIRDYDGFDTLQLDGVEDFSDLVFQRAGQDLQAGFKDSAARITLSNFYTYDGNVNDAPDIDRLLLSNGKTLSANAILPFLAGPASSGSTSGISSSVS